MTMELGPVARIFRGGGVGRGGGGGCILQELGPNS